MAGLAADEVGREITVIPQAAESAEAIARRCRTEPPASRPLAGAPRSGRQQPAGCRVTASPAPPRAGSGTQ